MTRRQQKFVEAYVSCLNATKAAKSAGYSLKSAHQIGHENLRKPEIQAAINKQIEASSISPRLLRSRLIAELVSISFGEQVATDSLRLRAMDLLSKAIGASSSQSEENEKRAEARSLMRQRIGELAQKFGIE